MPPSVIRRLMRQHGVTIRSLAARLQVSQRRVREVRATGLRDPQYIRDWKQAMTGCDPGACNP